MNNDKHFTYLISMIRGSFSWLFAGKGIFDSRKNRNAKYNNYKIYNLFQFDI